MDTAILLKAINNRLDFGRTKYGHGIRVSDDTTNFHTQQNSWVEMMQEEILDAINYTTAQIIRDTKTYCNDNNIVYEIIIDNYTERKGYRATDDNDDIMLILEAYNKKEIEKYQLFVNPKTTDLFKVLGHLMQILELSISNLK